MKQDLNGVRTPEDVMRRLAENVKVTADEVDGLTVEVSKKVGDDEIISKINQSAEQVSINANKIKLEGYTTINNGFSVDTQGNMKCNNATMNDARIEGGSLDVISTADNPQIRVKDDSSSLETILHGAGLFVWDSDNNDAFVTINTLGSFGGSDTMNGYIALREGENNYTPTIELYGEGGMIIGKTLELGINISLDGTSSKIKMDSDTGKITCVQLTQTSLEEKKKNFEKLDNALEIVKDTDIYKYNFKNENDTDKKHIGFVIGKDYKYREEITDTDNKGAELYSMISVLWKAVQEQQEEIEKLKKEVKNDKN